MISLTPTGSPAQTSDAYALFAILADPDASRKRLEELVAEKKAALDMKDQAVQAQTDADKACALAADELAKVKSAADAFNASSVVRTQALEDREAVLKAMQQDIEDHEESMLTREINMKGRETAVAQREQFLIAREEAATKLAADAKMVKDAYDAKISALQSAMATAPAKSELKAEAV